MKSSKQRDLILSIINSRFDHPTAYQIYTLARNEISNISLGTVYRNLNLLLDKGMIRKINVDDDICRFDKAFDKHSHFICNYCKNIYDIKDDALKIDFVDGNKVLNYDITYTGICQKCLKEEEK